jgi:hypothetical protein
LPVRGKIGATLRTPEACDASPLSGASAFPAAFEGLPRINDVNFIYYQVAEMRKNVRNFPADAWALARLCSMYPVLAGLAIWYFSRADRLVQAVSAR